ncbi:MAG: hypothetical protein IE925_11365 [Rhodobacterales bacterium]|jgi:hypothetical protein|nr:hypothetical protein [Rhodobacterales bacterium]
MTPARELQQASALAIMVLGLASCGQHATPEYEYAERCLATYELASDVAMNAMITFKAEHQPWITVREYEERYGDITLLKDHLSDTPDDAQEKITPNTKVMAKVPDHLLDQHEHLQDNLNRLSALNGELYTCDWLPARCRYTDETILEGASGSPERQERIQTQYEEISNSGRSVDAMLTDLEACSQRLT